jgi:hypothetical protein
MSGRADARAVKELDTTVSGALAEEQRAISPSSISSPERAASRAGGSYRQGVASAAADDIGVGISLRPGSPRRESLSPSGVNVLDLYHFDVERLSEVRLQLTQPLGRAFALILLTNSGVPTSARRSASRNGGR